MEYISRGELMQEKGNNDLSPSSSHGWWESTIGNGWATLSLHNTQQVKQAVEAYRRNAEPADNDRGEVLPRVDDYT